MGNWKNQINKGLDYDESTKIRIICLKPVNERAL